MKDKELHDFRKLILAAQGKCSIVPPRITCVKGKFPNCEGGKTAIVKAYIHCKE